ncbi:hypothetical protein HYH02_014925 [Chlamydomonas schloesseri]|uniref:Protein kinase domain-containing protein n=1 Tax=Chlamydomonas schloesseri TaxID=2026947 RepID=A0A835VUQ0_9CHLO|nr:hypothetical protein HYH02_014925 [Chlamydomonas schloesseri]|eukprot:KAG2425861.1 hypothetical protein HYH02_014925 [Chlamydomonas schloesseri]
MFGAALRQVAAKGAELASNLVREVESVASTAAATVGPYGTAKFQSQFKLGAQLGSVGGLWRLYAGSARSANAVVKDVSIWVLDKKELLSRGDGGTLPAPGSSGLLQSSSGGPGLGASGTGGGSGAAPGQRWEAVFEQQRHGCALMTRLKHPGVVRVVLPLEETSSYMVLVTEAVRGCLRDIMSAPQHPQHQQPHTTAGHGGAHGLGHSDQGGAEGGPGPSPSSSSAAVGGGAGLSCLEVKLGLLAVAEALTFLHSAAKLAHCGLSPQTVVVAADGGWKLAGFGFAVTEAGPRGGSAGPPPYAYNDPFPPLWEELAKPQLPYTAPELVVPPGGSVGPWAHTANHFGAAGGGASASWAAADAFSLGALAYELVTWAAAAEAAAGPGGVGGVGMEVHVTAQQLLPVRCSVQQYGARMGALAAAAAGGGGTLGLGSAAPVASDLARVPPELRGMLLSLVSPAAASRPAPAALARCAWFEDDGLLRALRFLEGIMQSEPRHKLAFLSDLAAPAPGPGPGAPGPLWQRMSDRLLTGRVLPPLLQEVRNGGTVGVAALPVVLAVCGRLGRGVFASVALPVLAPVMEAAAGGGGGGGGGAGGGGGGGGGVPGAGGGGGAGAAEAAALLPALVSQSEALAALMDGPTLDKVLLPLLVRALVGPGAAADGGVAGAGAAADPRLAQAALTRLQALVAAGLVDAKSAQARTRLLPALHSTVGRTTSAGVRSACLALMAALAGKVDRSEAEGMLATCAQLLSVDTSGNTLVAVAGLAEALAEAPGWGPPATATRLLPLLTPHLVAPTLTPMQLTTFSAAIQAMMRRVVRYAEEAAALRASGGDPSALPGAAGLGASAAATVPESSAGSSNSRGSGAAGSGSVVAFTTWTHSKASTSAATTGSSAYSTAPTPAASLGSVRGPGGAAAAAAPASSAAPTWPAKQAAVGGGGSGGGVGGGTAASTAAGGSAPSSSSSSSWTSSAATTAGSSNGNVGMGGGGGGQRPMSGGGGGYGAAVGAGIGTTGGGGHGAAAAAAASLFGPATSSSVAHAHTSTSATGASRDPFAASATAPPAPMVAPYSSTTPAPTASYAPRPAAPPAVAAPPDPKDPFAASVAPLAVQPHQMHASSSAPSLPYGPVGGHQLGGTGAAGAGAGAGAAGPALSAAQIANLAAAGLIVGGGGGGGGGAAGASKPVHGGMGAAGGVAAGLGGWGASAPAPAAPAAVAPMPTPTLPPPPAPAPRHSGGPVNLMDL